METVNYRRSRSKIFIIAGSSQSGKDYIVSAIRDLAKNKAIIVTKRTTRKQQLDDESELICADIIDKDVYEKSGEVAYVPNPKYDLNECDITYTRRGNTYGVKSSEIWMGLQRGMFQILSLSDAEAINQVIKMFGELVVLIFAYSNKKSSDYDESIKLYFRNADKFNHVVIFEDKKEDLYDQIFRLLYYYENN